MTIGSGFSNPIGVAVDAAGDVFVADYRQQRRQGGPAQRHDQHHRLRVQQARTAWRWTRPATSSSPTTATTPSRRCCPTAPSRPSAPGCNASGVAVDAAGDVFVAEDGNTSGRRALAADGRRDALAAHGHDGDGGLGHADRLDTRHHLLRPHRRHQRRRHRRRYSTDSFTATQTTTTTTTTLTSSANPAYLAQPVTFTAVVAPVTPGGPTPTGSVSSWTTALRSTLPPSRSTRRAPRCSPPRRSGWERTRSSRFTRATRTTRRRPRRRFSRAW